MSQNRFLNAQIARFEQNKKPYLRRREKLAAKVQILVTEINQIDAQIAAVDHAKDLFITSSAGLMTPETETAGVVIVDTPGVTAMVLEESPAENGVAEEVANTPGINTNWAETEMGEHPENVEEEKA